MIIRRDFGLIRRVKPLGLRLLDFGLGLVRLYSPSARVRPAPLPPDWRKAISKPLIWLRNEMPRHPVPGSMSHSDGEAEIAPDLLTILDAHRERRAVDADYAKPVAPVETPKMLSRATITRRKPASGRRKPRPSPPKPSRRGRIPTQAPVTSEDLGVPLRGLADESFDEPAPDRWYGEADFGLSDVPSAPVEPTSAPRMSEPAATPSHLTGTPDSDHEVPQPSIATQKRTQVTDRPSSITPSGTEIDVEMSHVPAPTYHEEDLYAALVLSSDSETDVDEEPPDVSTNVGTFTSEIDAALPGKAPVPQAPSHDARSRQGTRERDMSVSATSEIASSSPDGAVSGPNTQSDKETQAPEELPATVVGLTSLDMPDMSEGKRPPGAPETVEAERSVPTPMPMSDGESPHEIGRGHEPFDTPRPDIDVGRVTEAPRGESETVSGKLGPELTETTQPVEGSVSESAFEVGESRSDEAALLKLLNLLPDTPVTRGPPQDVRRVPDARPWPVEPVGGGTGVIMEAEEVPDDTSQASPTVGRDVLSLEKLARQVYRLVRERLRIERERRA